jgi:hypothetical protein
MPDTILPCAVAGSRAVGPRSGQYAETTSLVLRQDKSLGCAGAHLAKDTTVGSEFVREETKRRDESEL